MGNVAFALKNINHPPVVGSYRLDKIFGDMTARWTDFPHASVTHYSNSFFSLVRRVPFQYNESAKKGKEEISSMKKEAQPRHPTQNLVVAKHRDGRMIKGVTYNFGSEKKAFHVIPLSGEQEEGIRKGVEVVIPELKAIFFVKSLDGRKGPRTLEGLLEEEEEQTIAMKVKVTFHDGETLIGTTHGYSRDKQGFFIVPLEKESNNLRVFIVFNAAREIDILK